MGGFCFLNNLHTAQSEKLQKLPIYNIWLKNLNKIQ